MNPNILPLNHKVTDIENIFKMMIVNGLYAVTLAEVIKLS